MRQSLTQSFILGSLAAMLAASTYVLHPSPPAFYAIEEPLKQDEVGLQEIAERWKNEVLWLDARPREQFEQEHIPEAHLLNEQEFDGLLLELLETLQTTTRPVIIYCGGQKCEASRHVREKLLTMVPVENCFVLKGGFPAWKAAH